MGENSLKSGTQPGTGLTAQKVMLINLSFAPVAEKLNSNRNVKLRVICASVNFLAFFARQQHYGLLFLSVRGSV
jgi:hypothetical protein